MTLARFNPGGPWRRAIRGAWLAAIVMSLGLYAAVFAKRSHAETLDLDGYQVTFDETFKTLDISGRGPGTRWIAHTPWNGDFGDAVFDDPGPDGPFSLTQSGLRITARRKDGRWHSGLICSMDRDGPGQIGFAQRFGYFEMRAKFPDGTGVWPAFWLIGVDKTRSASEIDVVEYYGAFPSYFHSWMHIFVSGKDVLLKDHLMQVEPGSLTSKFNDYGVSVEPDLVRLYLNRQLVWSQPTPPEYHQKMYLLADLAIGGGWPSDKLTSPVSMEIEHIVVYQKTSRLSAGDGQR